MIADFLRKGLAWARAFFWVSDSDTSEGTRSTGPARPAGGSAPGGKAAAKSGLSSGQSSGQSSAASGQRRSAAEKTSAGKRGAATAKGRTGQGGGAKTQSRATKSSGNQSTDAKSGGTKSAGAKTAGSKSTGPGQPEADPAKPGDLTDIKGIGPKMKTQLAEMGIKSFADLAGADAKQIANRLDSRTITPERVRGWIAEAKKRS